MRMATRWRKKELSSTNQAITRPMSTKSLPLRSNMPWRPLAEDRAMLLNLDSGEYYELRGAAPYIWIHLDGKMSLEEIAQKLVSVYGIDESRARNDLNALINDLNSNSLLANSANGPGADDLSDGKNITTREMPYETPTVSNKGNLKYLGQLD
ncbi:MAG: hypothetical protein CMJ80_17695 [Planctomycetaceae bacterium]|nr:hypothetical protein [Planctomycetaceae bacterium]